MISPASFYETLKEHGVGLFAGVPDSLLKNFCAYVTSHSRSGEHVICANEGSAIALATGHYLATGKLALVYMQNSGLGNSVNPLLSLADPEVYAIPMLLLVGWRGEPGVKDEPQHIKQGRVSPALLEAMEIPYRIMDADTESLEENIRQSIEQAYRQCGPVALLVRKGTFAKAPESSEAGEQKIKPQISRERAIELVTSLLPEDAVVVSTTGKISRELYEHRLRGGQNRAGDFLTVGSMGHASHIALGIALAGIKKPVVCLDGDGALLMHMGGMAIIGTSKANNLLHVVLNNGVHDSVGGQPTVGFDVSLVDIARACGYRKIAGPVSTEADIRKAMADMLGSDGPAFLEIQVRPGSRADLGRPRETLAENKKAFMERLRPS